MSISTQLRHEYDTNALETLASITGSHNNNNNQNPSQLCHSCHIVRPTRSKHCRVLNRCILLFDHHCPFVGTTIGLYNYKYFYLFVWFFTITDILFTTTGVLHLKVGNENHTWEIGSIVIVIYFSLYTIMTGGLTMYHTQLIHKNLSTNEHQNMYKYKYLFVDDANHDDDCCDESNNGDNNQTKDNAKRGGGAIKGTSACRKPLSMTYKNPFDLGFFRNFKKRFVPGKDSYIVMKQQGSGGNTSNKKTDEEESGGEKISLVSNIV
mmetsp:Transcript_6907/g.8726  ORF Transcript_6907/g.8726 Transcript_6907/m.8726 type:complete len:265 (-) Transcript_6907:2058-2852(-)